MMLQKEKVERFQFSESTSDAVHSLFNVTNGHTVVADHEWGHLQLDAVSLYILMLAQMTASGKHANLDAFFTVQGNN